MSRESNKKKKSTSKYRKFRVSPLIPVIAIVEVLVLIAVSTYAWFYLSSDKTATIGTISVDADSGLDIDFKYANEQDTINIWNYIDKDFKFEPVTSLDGRNVFIPTTGTFNSTTTSEMTFREGTVNDINSKYINIDFELTNTTDYNMKVYLNNNSYFYVKDKTSGENDESRALRLAFYPNNGSVGNVSSQLIGGSADYSNNEEQHTSGTLRTVYFDNTKWTGNQASKNWDKVYVYLWRDSGTKPTLEAWPGTEMTSFSGPIYSFSYSEDDVVFDKVIFSDGNNHKTADLDFHDNGVYDSSGYQEKTFTSNTVYFVKPNTWNNVYVHAWRLNSSNQPQHYTSWNGNNATGLDEMKHVGSGIYSYTFDGDSDGVKGLLFTNGKSGENNQTVDISVSDGNINDKIYYINGKDSNNSNKYSVVAYGTDYSNMGSKTLFFYNSLGWATPYCTGLVDTGNDTYTNLNTIKVPMTSLTGNVYYCNLPDIYSKAYFCDNSDNSKRTVSIPATNIPLTSGYVYRTLGTKSIDSTNYDVNCFRYNDYTADNGYAVISPGVSAGFQRTYTPIVQINNTTGAVSQVIPAFANSIDNYIFGNTAGPEVNGERTSQTVFEIPSKNVLSLSMVIWLEGTDPACTGETYAANNIELRLEFASSYTDSSDVVHNVNTYGSQTYTYNFYDKTREVWTSDRITASSGVSFAPVMQLYDATLDRGYLMHGDRFKTIDGKTKVTRWTVDAPQSIATWGHDIIFRRVNPYNENEVWNYWHAGRVAGGDNDEALVGKTQDPNDLYTVYDCAFSNGNTISFTAFSDGSPTSEMLTNNVSAQNAANANVPAVSCGGLWGNHDVRTLTLVDGVHGQSLQNDGSMLTISYEFQYTATISGVSTPKRNVKIEYKASGKYDSIYYYFIVPDVIYNGTDPFAFDGRGRPSDYSEGLYCTFKRYTHYSSSYATNSASNSELEFAGSYTGGKPTGDYFVINYTKSSSGSENNYWGSDILYIRASSATSDYMQTGWYNNVHYKLQAHFYANSGGGSRYAYLYGVSESKIKGSAASAFVAVVPNDVQYNQYRLETVDHDNTSNVYCSTPYQTITNGTSETIAARSGYSSNSFTLIRNHLNNNNLLTLDHMYIKLFIQVKKGCDLLDSNRPKIYLWNGSTNNGWPGAEMGYDSDDQYWYCYTWEFDVPKYTKFKIVKNTDSSKASNDSPGDLNPLSNYDVMRVEGSGKTPYKEGNMADWYSTEKGANCAVTGPSTMNMPHYTVKSS